ncbi:MAG: phosphodiester glycosidase family protein [Hyphomicrobiaceae bacterium]
MDLTRAGPQAVRALAGIGILLVLLALSTWPARPQQSDRTPGLATALEAASWVALRPGVSRLQLSVQSGIRLLAFRLDHGALEPRIIVADDRKGQRVADIVATTGAVLAINGGYFDAAADGTLTPTGLVISRGQHLHPLTSCRACSGVLVVSGGRIDIRWANAFVPSARVASALQVGPLLVEPGGRNGINRQTGPKAARSAVCVTPIADIIVAVASPLTLYELATLLRQPPPAGFGCDTAINLDGGPSTSLASTLSGPAVTFGASSKVQNFLAFFAP